MHARIRELLRYLDDTGADLRAAVDAVPPPLRSRKPAADRWSVAEVLEHLSLVEQRIANMAAAQIQAGRTGGLGPDTNTVGTLESFDAHRVVDRSRRLIAAEATLPHQGLDEPAAWAALVEARDAVRTAILGGDGLNLGELVIPHSVMGHMNLYHWVAFIGAHELRHAAQIREIAAQLST